MRRWMYDAMYRVWAPWDAVGVRDDLRSLLESGRVTATSHPRVVDLGCGTGANAVFLAEHGFQVVGVDFSPVALAKAEARAAKAGVACRFVAGDLTADLSGLGGPFDLALDFGTLDDLGARRPPGHGGQRPAAHPLRLAVPVLVLLRRPRRSAPVQRDRAVPRGPGHPIRARSRTCSATPSPSRSCPAATGRRASCSPAAEATRGRDEFRPSAVV